MKKLIVLLLLNYALFAQNIVQTIPLALQKKLCDQLAHNNNRCENGSTLDYATHTILKNNQLLVFVYLNEHAHTSPMNSKSTIPLIIDSLGRWTSTVGNNIISENIESIHQDPHGNIWVRATWETEGVYPAYYHSKHGLHWKRTVLPKDRNVDCCFETVDKPLFLFNALILTFRDSDNKNVKSWGSSYTSAMSDNPVWQPLNKAPRNGIETIVESNWKITKSKSKISFLNTYTNNQLYLPRQSKATKTVYQIQIGAYSKKSLAKKAQKSLTNIPYFSYTQQSKKYVKLFIGEFSTLKKAKFILAKLKREHPKNTMLQKAFVAISKP